MAARFLAIVSKQSGSPRSSRYSIPDLPIDAKLKGTNVHLNQDGMAVPVGDDGLVLGDLFTRGAAPARVRSIPEDTARRIKAGRGDLLISAYWGGYVAILHTGVPGQISILRDPSGTLPCYYREEDAAIYVASDLDSLLSISTAPLAIDWDYLSVTNLPGAPPTSQTALTGIRELLPGWRLDIDDRTTDLARCWSPWDHVDFDDTPDAQQIEQLEATVVSSLGTWGRRFNHVLVGVSGGLDSSIVAAGLKGSTAVTCFTMVTNEPSGDERTYAQAMAQTLDLPLEEVPYKLDQVNVARTTAAHLPRPGVPSFSQANLATRQALTAKFGIDAYFSGVGGDNVFCLMTSATPILDALLARGAGPEAFTALRDVCKLTGCSVWDAGRAVIERWRTRDLPHQLPRNLSFLSAQDVPLPGRADETNTWLQRPVGSLPGKAAHVAKVMSLQYMWDLFHRSEAGPHILPLFSQPIVELCLRIPTWKWCSKGMNRSFARQAFAKRLPSSVVHRRSKGGPDSFAFDLALTNRKAIREQLLGGALAQAGLLDTQAIEESLSETRAFGAGEHLRLLTLTEAEAWARFWSTKLPSQIPATPQAFKSSASGPSRMIT